MGSRDCRPFHPRLADSKEAPGCNESKQLPSGQLFELASQTVYGHIHSHHPTTYFLGKYQLNIFQDSETPQATQTGLLPPSLTFREDTPQLKIGILPGREEC